MDFAHKDETRKIIGWAMEVHRELGAGLTEKPYENALVVEFGLQGVEFEQQARFDVRYKEVKVGEFVPDLIAFGSVVIDTKAIKEITDREIAQMMSYLRVTGLTVGLIINFANPSLQWKRVVYNSAKPSKQDVSLL